MYIYNVTIKVTHEIEDAWKNWMLTEHMNEVIDTKMFDSYSFHELLEPIDEEGKTFVAQYFTDSEQRYQQYINDFAPLLREKGYAKFGNQFIAFRSVMKILQSS